MESRRWNGGGEGDTIPLSLPSPNNNMKGIKAIGLTSYHHLSFSSSVFTCLHFFTISSFHFSHDQFSSSSRPSRYSSRHGRCPMGRIR